MSMDTPILAIACGPTVTTWDIAKSTTSQETSCFDAKSLAGAGTGVEQFRPHGDNDVKYLSWNHNGQVIASCSNSMSLQDPQNVVLTHYSTRAKLESFSNFHTTSSGSGVSKSAANELSMSPSATSISFGGKSAKSRYLCVSDEGGSASVWDMKKISRVRCFKMKNSDSGIGTGRSGISSTNIRPSCVKCTMDPSDSHVVALHGDSSFSNRTKRIALEMFHLKTGSRVTMLKTNDYQYGGGADCFEFSNSDDGKLLVGARDGSLLLWDCSVTAIKDNLTPLSILERRHKGSVTDVAFSPMNHVLAASCSTDGTVSFHDIDSNKTIQTIRPLDHPIKFVNKDGASDGQGLTSIAFHHDGYTWGVGTEKGLVFTYDLRQTGTGPLCTMNVSGIADDPINRLQFLQTKPSTGPKSAVKKKVSLGDDGAVTIEQEKSTPSRKEITKTTYSLQKDHPSISSSADTGTSTLISNGKPVTKCTEKIVKRTTTTSKKITSPNRRTTGNSIGGMTTLLSPPVETTVESTSTNEVTTSSSQQPSTTKRITKNKVITSSPQRPVAPAGHKIAFDGSSKRKGLDFDDLNFGSLKKDAAVSFDNQKIKIPFNDLTFGDNISLSEDSSDSGAEQMMEDFDKMYERIKNRALKEEEKQPLREEPPKIVRSTDFSEAGRNDTVGGDEMITISKTEVRDMIEDAVESLRDDMEEVIQSLQLDFLRQLQNQSDEITALLNDYRGIQDENESLKNENESLRRRF